MATDCSELDHSYPTLIDLERCCLLQFHTLLDSYAQAFVHVSSIRVGGCCRCPEMGGLLFKAVAKNGSDKLDSNETSLMNIGATRILGERVDKLGDIIGDKKAIMVVNVATN